MNRRDLLKRLPFVAGAALVPSCAELGGLTNGLIPQYLISNDMIMKELLPFFPFNRNYNGIGSVSLTQPKLSFAPDINKVRLGLGVEAGLTQGLAQMTGISSLGSLAGKKTGFAQVACGLRYDKESRGIFLQSPSVESLQLDNIPGHYTNTISSLINEIAPSILNKKPIHTLEPSLATRFLGSMKVQQNGIALGFGLV